MKKRMHFEMRDRKRMDGDFKTRFEGRTVGTDMVFDGGNIGCG
jgi:hypothetical protein